MTIPNLMAEHRKQVYVASLKTFYSQISQAVEKIKYDTNCNDIACVGLGASVDDDTWNDNLYNLITSQLNIVKYTKKPSSKDRLRFYDLEKAHVLCDMTCVTAGASKDVVFYTKSGSKFEIFTSNADFGLSLYVDVNGDKGPNVMGRDVFDFHIPANLDEVVPRYGYKYSHVYLNNPGTWWQKASNLCNKGNSSAANGRGCAARIIESGWKMDY